MRTHWEEMFDVSQCRSGTESQMGVGKFMQGPQDKLRCRATSRKRMVLGEQGSPHSSSKCADVELVVVESSCLSVVDWSPG